MIKGEKGREYSTCVCPYQSHDGVALKPTILRSLYKLTGGAVGFVEPAPAAGDLSASLDLSTYISPGHAAGVVEALSRHLRCHREFKRCRLDDDLRTLDEIEVRDFTGQSVRLLNLLDCTNLH